ncbi:MAG: hypothetical protein ABSE40_22925 [Candidatus Sulfotelmatobacter sp.]
MPLRYAIDKQRRLVHTTAWDRLTFAETQAYEHQLWNDPDFDPEFNQLVDLTALTGSSMSVEEIKQIARRSGFSAMSRRAFVAPATAVFGMSRLFALYNEMSKTPTQIHIFHDLPSALKWLGLETLPPLSQ